MSTFQFAGKTYDVKKLHTKQLIKLLRDIQPSLSYEYDLYDEVQKEEKQIDQIRSIIKEELSQREHVPNKLEAKEIRRLKAKQKRNR